MSSTSVPHRPFTGRHMAIIMVSFFLVVVGVNVTMAMLANKSWTGLVVQNSYVASQHFNTDTAKREAVLALGYKLSPSYTDGHIHLLANDKNGKALQVSSAELKLNRMPNDPPLSFVCSRGQCSVAALLTPGLWRGDLKILLAGQEDWSQAIELFVKEN